MTAIQFASLLVMPIGALAIGAAALLMTRHQRTPRPAGKGALAATEDDDTAAGSAIKSANIQNFHTEATVAQEKAHLG